MDEWLWNCYQGLVIGWIQRVDSFNRAFARLSPNSDMGDNGTHEILAAVHAAKHRAKGDEEDEEDEAEWMSGGVAAAWIFDDIEHFKTLGESAAQIDSGLCGVWGGHPAPTNQTLV